MVVGWRVENSRAQMPYTGSLGTVPMQSLGEIRAQPLQQSYNREPGSRYPTHIRATLGLYMGFDIYTVKIVIYTVDCVFSSTLSPRLPSLGPSIRRIYIMVHSMYTPFCTIHFCYYVHFPEKCLLIHSGTVGTPSQKRELKILLFVGFENSIY